MTQALGSPLHPDQEPQFYNAPSLEFLKNLLHGQGEKEIIGVGIYLRESVDTGCIRLMNGVALDKKKEGAGNRSEPTL